VSVPLSISLPNAGPSSKRAAPLLGIVPFLIINVGPGPAWEVNLTPLQGPTFALFQFVIALSI
jgi:hypothetical protein